MRATECARRKSAASIPWRSFAVHAATGSCARQGAARSTDESVCRFPSCAQFARRLYSSTSESGTNCLLKVRPKIGRVIECHFGNGGTCHLVSRSRRK